MKKKGKAEQNKVKSIACGFCCAKTQIANWRLRINPSGLEKLSLKVKTSRDTSDSDGLFRKRGRKVSGSFVGKRRGCKAE